MAFVDSCEPDCLDPFNEHDFEFGYVWNDTMPFDQHGQWISEPDIMAMEAEQLAADGVDIAALDVRAEVALPLLTDGVNAASPSRRPLLRRASEQSPSARPLVRRASAGTPRGTDVAPAPKRIRMRSKGADRKSVV